MRYTLVRNWYSTRLRGTGAGAPPWEGTNETMAKRKLTEEQTQALLDDYDRWQKFDPDSESADELAARHGVTKPTLYYILRQRRLDAKSPATSPEVDVAGLQAAVRYLTEELVKARLEVEQLAGQLEGSGQKSRPRTKSR